MKSKVVLGSLLIALMGCSPGSATSDGKAPLVPTDDTTELFSFGDRSLAVASHGISMLSESRRLIDEALALIPNVRIQSLPGQPYSLGCRTYRKISPHPAPEKPGSDVERFAISYNRCLDGADKLTFVELTGTEVYQLSYPAPFPKAGDGREIDLPTSISIETVGLKYKGRLASSIGKGSAEVIRRYVFQALPIGGDDLQLFYRGTLEATDSYKSIIDGVERTIEMKSKLTSVDFVISRENRKAMRIVPSEIFISAFGKQNVAGSSVPPREFGYDAHYFGAGEMTLTEGPCEWPSGALKLQRGEAEMVDVVSAAGVVTLEQKQSPYLNSCTIDRLTKSYVPSSALHMQTLYF